jgi:hypothetical protein
MAAEFIAQCPGCQAKLRLKRQFEGRKIRCPKCAEVFKAAAPRAKGDDIGEPDESGPLEDDFAEEPVARPRRAQSAAPAALPARIKKSRPSGKSSTKGTASETKKASDKSGSNVKLFAILGVSLVVCLVGGLGLFAVKSLMGGRGGLLAKLAGGPSNSINMKYLPERPEVILCIRVADVWKSPAGKTAAADTRFAKTIDLYGKTIGMSPEDIETVTLAVAAPSGNFSKLSQIKAASGEGDKSETRIVVVVRSKKPFDKKLLGEQLHPLSWNKVEGKDVEWGRFDGHPLFKETQATALFLPEPQTLVFGTMLTIPEIANGGPNLGYVRALDSVDPKQHLILATVPEHWPHDENMMFGRNEDEVSSRLRIIGRSLLGSQRAAAVGLTFGSSLKVRFNCEFDSSSAAAEQQKVIADDIDSQADSGAEPSEIVIQPGKKNKKEEHRPTHHINPLQNMVLYDFRAASRDKTNKLAWSEGGGSGIEFRATIKSQDALEQANHILPQLTFYHEKFDPRKVRDIRDTPPAAEANGDAPAAEDKDNDAAEAPKQQAPMPAPRRRGGRRAFGP